MKMSEKSFSFDSIDLENQFGFTYLQLDMNCWLYAIRESLRDTKDKDKLIQRLIIEYFKERTKISIQTQFFCQRIEVQPFQKINFPIQNRFILYGVDFLSTQMIKQVFQPNTVRIRWIDDSSCFVFTNLQQSKAILRRLVIPPCSQMVEKGGPPLYQKWLQLQSYYVFGLQRKLFIRYATNNDEYLCKSKANSYGRYQYYRNSMPFYFLSKLNAVRIYEQAANIQFNQQYETENDQQQDQYEDDSEQQSESQGQQIMNISITANVNDGGLEEEEYQGPYQLLHSFN